MKVHAGVQRANKVATEAVDPSSQIVEHLSQAIAKGEFTEGEWDAYAVWMMRHSTEAGQPDFELLGGATGLRWLDEHQRQLTKAAALEEPKEEEEIETADVIAGAIDYMNLRDHAAFMRVWTVLEVAAKNALRRAVAKATSTIRNDEVKAKMASAARPLDEIDENLWESAKLDTSTRHIIDSTIDDAVIEVADVLAEEAGALARIGRVLGASVDENDVAAANVEAIEVLRNNLSAEIERWVRPRDGEPENVVGPTLVRQVMAVAGGADAVSPTEKGFPVRRGRIVPAGFGLLNGPLFFEMLGRVTAAENPPKVAAVAFPDGILKVKYKWRHGYYREPASPFDPHRLLNGRVFLPENWENLQSRRKDADDWPYVEPITEDPLVSYTPGDHDGCTCAVIPVVGGRGRRVLGPEWFQDAMARTIDTDVPEARVAAFSPNQPRCPQGTGRTAGRFSNERLINCNPLVTQLSNEALVGRIRSLSDDIAQGDLSAEKEARLRSEIALAEQELEGRKPDQGGVADDPSIQTEGEPEFGPGVETDELDNLANEMGGFTVKEGHDTPTSGYAVAFENAEVVLDDWASLSETEQEAHIAKYLLEHEQTMIENPRAYFGAWIDEDGKMYLDLSEAIEDLEEAASVGVGRNQLGIFGFEDFETLTPTEVLKEEFDYDDEQIEEILSAAQGRKRGRNGQANSGNGSGEANLAKVAVYSPTQPRCPGGTGETAGRFSNRLASNCLPQVTQLSHEALAGRIKRMTQLLDSKIDWDRRQTLERELALAREEAQRRLEEGSTPENGGVKDQVADPSAVMAVNN